MTLQEAHAIVDKADDTRCYGPAYEEALAFIEENEQEEEINR